MADKKKSKKTTKRSKIFEARYFGFIIAAVIILAVTAISEGTIILDNLERKVEDVHFRFKNLFQAEEIQEGVKYVERNPRISKDILIVGIDFRTLSEIGRWPFPRYTHADLLNTFTRIRNQQRRERAVLLDIFFNEPSDNAVYDGVLVDSIQENGRVFLETLLDESPPPDQKRELLIERQKTLLQQYGEITDVSGNWEELWPYFGVQPPLRPYGKAAAGYGHANYLSDQDDIFRRQPLIAKFSEKISEVPFRELTSADPVDREQYERFAWTDKEGRQHTIPHPINKRVLENLEEELKASAPKQKVDTDNDGNIDDTFYVIRKYRDYFIPAVTLTLALEYFNKEPSDVEVKIGDYIRIPQPQQFNTKTGIWEPYTLQIEQPEYDKEGNLVKEGKSREVKEITIPIDTQGNMRINYMGPPSFSSPGARQTFPVRSYAGYAQNPPGPNPSSWPSTRALDNKIVMVGSFTRGMAADHKPTPYGLMYGVEIHANALNTILMDNFLVAVPWWIDALVLLGMVFIVAFLSSRVSTPWAFISALLMIAALFFVSSILFDIHSMLLNFSNPAIATFFTLISIVIYRVVTEEKDKRRIRSMFGTYVSPKVVDQILENPPELGGVDKEITVYFSDIRGFTTISESMTPQELVRILNKYLTAMTDIILKYEGTLDKYEGDAVMCFWGAPLPQEDHALRACKCAVEQLQALRELNDSLPEDQQLDIGIGINSGRMTVGNMGSTQRMDYTLIGDNVNLGARLEGTNKQYKTRVIISEYTYGLVKDQVVVRELDNIRVKGKQRPVLIYELIDIKDNPVLVSTGVSSSDS